MNKTKLQSFISIAIWVALILYLVLEYYFNIEHVLVDLIPFIILGVMCIPLIQSQGSTRVSTSTNILCKNRSLSYKQSLKKEKRLKKLTAIVEKGCQKYAVTSSAIRALFISIGSAIFTTPEKALLLTFPIAFILSYIAAFAYWKDILAQLERIKLELKEGCHTKIKYKSFSAPSSVYIIGIALMTYSIQIRLQDYLDTF